MTDLVDQTLAYWRKVPFSWDEENCMLSIADYVLAATGNDYGARFRGKCLSETDALRYIRQFEGETRLIDISGLEATDNPQRGDILLIEFMEKAIPGICTGQGVAMRLVRGVVEIDVRHVKTIKAWKVTQCRQ